MRRLARAGMGRAICGKGWWYASSVATLTTASRSAERAPKGMSAITRTTVAAGAMPIVLMYWRWRGLANRQFTGALRAFKAGDVVLVREGIHKDDKVTPLAVKVDDECSHLMVLHQPMANDLCMVVATLKIITHLERIGDESSKFARAVQSPTTQAGCGGPWIGIRQFASWRAIPANC